MCLYLKMPIADFTNLLHWHLHLDMSFKDKVVAILDFVVQMAKIL